MLKTFNYNKMPVVEVVNEIMVDSAKRGASDIHFDPLENVMKVRIRIDGTLIDYAIIPNDIKKNLITRIKIIAGMNITESRLPQDGSIKATVQGTSLDLRVSTIPTNMGEKIVIRILDYSLSGAGIENLGFSDSNYKKVIDMINQPNGIILVTGATGTGKSTTVYSILQRLNKEESNIITVEDPVEMNIEGVNQIQANSEIGLDFATALRSILRQDPNIIMIGEIRDTETAKIAIRASITGHLVLSTLHTNDSLNTIERLLDMDVERYLLASSLTGIIAQKLARKLCPECRKKRKTNKFERKLFESALGHKVNEIYTACGCEKCHNGYTGRIAIQEVLLINQQIRDAISSNARKNKLRDLVYTNEVDSLLQDGLSKVENGLTSMEELLKLIELENEDSSIARMGLEASMKLGKEVEDSIDNNDDLIIEDEPEEEVVENIEPEIIEEDDDTLEVIEDDEKLETTEEPIETIEVIEEPVVEEETTEEKTNKKDKKKNKKDDDDLLNKLLDDIKKDFDTDKKEEITIEATPVEEEVKDEFVFDLDNDTQANEINDINFDDLVIGDVNNIDFDDNIVTDNKNMIIDDIKTPLPLDEIKFDNIEEPTIEFDSVKVEPIIENEGLLDDDLSDASDEDIMNLFD